MNNNQPTSAGFPIDNEIIADDFDQIALCAPDHDGFWSHNSHYHRHLLAALPPHIKLAVDVGCGTGELSRALAARAQRVIGADISEQSLAAARLRSERYDNIEYVQDDVFGLDIADNSADAIVAVAVVHHLPFSPFLRWARRKLSPGGVLYIVDLYKSRTLADYAMHAVSFVPNQLREAAKRRALIRAGMAQHTAAAKYVWAMHGEHDVYTPLRDIRSMAEGELPCAIIKRRMYYRYTLEWVKR